MISSLQHVRLRGRLNGLTLETFKFNFIGSDDSFHNQSFPHHLFLKFLEFLSMIQRRRFVKTVLILRTS